MITLGERMSLHQGRIGDSLEKRERTPHQKVPGRHFAYPPVRKNACPPVRATNVELGVVFYLIPPATSRSPINKNGTMAEDALFTGKFIRAECVDGGTPGSTVL